MRFRHILGVTFQSILMLKYFQEILQDNKSRFKIVLNKGAYILAF